MKQVLLLLFVASLTGCVTLNTPVGQIVVPVEPVVAPMMRTPNAAWNCYVNIPHCLSKTQKK